MYQNYEQPPQRLQNSDFEVLFQYQKSTETCMKNIRPNSAGRFAVSKNSPNLETGLGNIGPLEALIDTKLILNEHE